MIASATKRAVSKYSLPGSALLFVLIAIVSHQLWQVEGFTPTGLLAATSRSLLILGLCALGLYLLVRLIGRLGAACGLRLGHWGSDAALRAFIEAKRRRLLRLRGRERPLARGRAQLHLGLALGELGTRGADRDALRQSAAAFRQALPALRLAGRGAKRVQTQRNLAATLLRLSRSELGRDSLKEAEAVLRAAAAARTALESDAERRELRALLCSVLTRLGRLEGGTTALAEAVAVGRAALGDDDTPMTQARRQVDLARALAALGEREAGSLRLAEAATLARDALRAILDDQGGAPQKDEAVAWRLQLLGTLGQALRCIGERNGDPEALREAVEALRSATPLKTGRNAYDWARVQDELARALLALGVQAARPELLSEAYSASESALSILTRAAYPFDWAVALSTRARTLVALVETEATLRRAGDDLRAALEVFDRIGAPLQGRHCRRDLDRIMALRARTLGREAEGRAAAPAASAPPKPRPA